MKNRRQFLRNTSLAALSVALFPKTGLASPKVRKTLSLDCTPTTLDFYGQGPFYTPNAPTLSDLVLASNDEAGERLIISGIVRNLDCAQVIPATEIDIWHANDAGQYDNDGFNLRGKVFSNEQGFYLFETILPGKYLNGSQFRPRHIHFRITPPGFDTLITQLYFEGDTDIPADAAASIDSGTYDASERTIPLTTNADGKLEGTWDIMVNGDGVNSTDDLHLEQGMIYSVGPNPFRDQVEIRYGVFRRARIQLDVYDLAGRQVATLEERELAPAKYTATWEPPAYLAAGHYWLTLRVNDLQVHYVKLLKQ